MSSLQEIKNKLLENNHVEELLEEIGCTHINYEQGNTLITAQLPDKFDSTNKRSVQIRLNDNLFSNIRSRDFKGDIFNLVSYIVFDERENFNGTLYKSVNYIEDLFGWSDIYDGIQIETIDYVKPLKDLYSYGALQHYEPNKPISEDVFKNFIHLPCKDWYDEGISILTQKEFGVAFDPWTHRIVFPYHNQYGQLVGIKGRAFEKDVHDYNPKYKYPYPCNINVELFNYHRAKKYIDEQKQVIIFEGEKSVMKMHTHGIFNTVALGSSSISEHQASLFPGYKEIEIVLAYDNDKTPQEIIHEAEPLDHGNTITFLYDADNLLGEKDSPIDKGIEIFDKLFEKRYNINEFINE